jgi:eukaryotic-like serine/threonine-protein kinase
VDAASRERLRREARAAARVSHPHICPLYEFDEDEGQPFLVMELLDGEPLSARLARGPMTPAEILTVACPMLDAMAALHRRGLLHRDLKPANVFLTPHGVKLLDFGLAQPPTTDAVTLDISGSDHRIRGTPRYMAPEQLLSGTADERSDLFAAGAVIYEMLAGVGAFPGRTLPEIVHAVVYLEPPPLDGSAELRTIDRLLRQALVKDPAKRLSRADVLAALLRDAVSAPQRTGPVVSGTKTRFVALPLRVLKPDPETDFLAFSVPDAVSMAIAGLESVIVRSPQAASGATADVRAIGHELGVDVVMTGTLLRAGRDVRVSAQLADARSGTIVWSHRTDAPIDDLFQLQDRLTDRIVSSIATPLSARDRHSLDRLAPASAEGYALYMRANQLMSEAHRWDEARDLYEQAVALDSDYAPAWAQLGRARRLIAKWGGRRGADLLPQAEAAFRRAFDLDPDLPIAHDLHAYVDAELGRAPDAMARLLHRAAMRAAHPDLLAGLVTTCRYAGLLDESLRAHQRAAAIDPARSTSVAWTHFMLGDYDQSIDADTGSPPFAAIVARLVKRELPVADILRLEAAAGSTGTRLGVSVYRHFLEERPDRARDAIDALDAHGFSDPEGWYLFAFFLARAGERVAALQLLERSLERGYTCHAQLVNREEWATLAGQKAFGVLVGRAEAMIARARKRFVEAGGDAVLALR